MPQQQMRAVYCTWYILRMLEGVKCSETPTFGTTSEPALNQLLFPIPDKLWTREEIRVVAKTKAAFLGFWRLILACRELGGLRMHGGVRKHENI